MSYSLLAGSRRNESRSSSMSAKLEKNGLSRFCMIIIIAAPYCQARGSNFFLRRPAVYSKEESRAHSTGRTLCGQGQNTSKSDMPQMAALLDNLDRGITPNFLDFLSAISEMVAFYTECDQIDKVRKLTDQKMSVKKCLFCS